MDQSIESTEQDETHHWQKGVPDPTNSRINHWSLNGYGQPVFTGGLYTPEEIRTLETTVRDYCASRSVTPVELCSENHNKAVRGAWHEIAQCLPHRTVLSVYRRALRQFAGHTVGKWSEEEIASLSRLVEVHGHKWKIIQDELGRSAHNCRSKFLELSDEFERGRWSTQKLELLIKSIREVLDVPRDDMDVREINEWTLESNSKIPWTIVSFRVLRGRVDCYFKWRQMTKRSNKIAVSMGLEPIPMARSTLKFDVKMEYYKWKAEQDPKWRKKYADKYILPLLHNDNDGKDSQIQLDDSLLAKIVQSKANRPSEVSWHSIRDINGISPRERFEELVDDYAPKDSLDLPLCELAKIVRDRLNKFVMAGSDWDSNAARLDSKERSTRGEKSNEIQSTSNIKTTSTATNLDTGTLTRSIKDILSTANRDEITVKGVRKLLEKQLGVKLNHHKDEIKALVIEML